MQEGARGGDNKETFGDNTYVHKLNCGDGFTGYTYVKLYTLNITCCYMSIMP